MCIYIYVVYVCGCLLYTCSFTLPFAFAKDLLRPDPQAFCLRSDIYTVLCRHEPGFINWLQSILAGGFSRPSLSSYIIIVDLSVSRDLLFKFYYKIQIFSHGYLG